MRTNRSVLELAGLKKLARRLLTREQTMAHNMRDLADRYLLPERPFRRTKQGFTLTGTRSRHHGDMQRGRFEPVEVELIERLLQDCDVFIDVGANIGFFTCLARSFGKRVVSIEPDQRNLRLLLKNLRENGWSDVEVWPIAVGACCRVATLYGASSTGASLIKGWAGMFTSVRRDVCMSTLDTLLGSRFNSEKLFVKIDVEGAEYDVLLGAKELIDRKASATLLVEICCAEHHPGGMNPNYRATFDRLWDAGYFCFAVSGEKISYDDVEAWIAGKKCGLNIHNFLFLREPRERLEGTNARARIGATATVGG